MHYGSTGSYRALFTGTAFAALALLTHGASAQTTDMRWQVLGEPGNASDTIKVCLVSDGRNWSEGDPSNPADCQEMLVAGLDTRTVWPDSLFYLRPLSRGQQSRLFRMNPFANYRLQPNSEAVLQALADSGAQQRLEMQIAASEQDCTVRYGAASSLTEVDRVRQTCGAFAGGVYRQAYSRILHNGQVSADARQQAEAARSRPRCSVVRFGGIVAGTAQGFEILQMAADPEDLVGRYPLHCGPSGFTQTYACEGAAYLTRRTGYVIAWSETGYQVATPVDLQLGRKDALVFIKRTDAACLDSNPPSLDFTANLNSFLKNHNRYR